MSDYRQWVNCNDPDRIERRPPCQPCPPCPPCPPCGRPYPPQATPYMDGPGPVRRRPPCGQRPGRPCYDRGPDSVHEMEEPDDYYMGDEAEQERMEQDWLYMKQLYPNIARKIHRYIDDHADQMEYENSPMYDEYPDQATIKKMVREILLKIQENNPELVKPMHGIKPQNGEEQKPETGCTDSTHPYEVLIQVMLLSEMHHRRWRYFKNRQRFY